MNQTGVPSVMQVTSLEGRRRAGVLTVKATFQVVGGRLELETDDPAPVLSDDEETELGLLPNDVHVPGDIPDFEVIVLGAACSARPVDHMTAELRVGDYRARLSVSGDRTWVGEGEHVAMGPPAPFTRMPLTWSRAYGGATDVWLDDRTRVPVQHPLNPDGLGFDAAAMARGFVEGGVTSAERLRMDYVRRLPNVEDPRAPIATPSDDPRPVCWATLPQSNALIPFHIASWRGEGRPPFRALQRSHPDLTLPSAPLGQAIELHGCTLGGPLAFMLLPLGLEADYVVGTRTGTITPRPQRLVILPEERRVLVTSHAYFTFDAAEEDERSLRLRRKD